MRFSSYLIRLSLWLALGLCGGVPWGNAQDVSGNADPGFHSSLAAGASVQAATVLPDGEILAGGDFEPGVALLNADGSADTSFAPAVASLDSQYYAFNQLPVCAVGVRSDGEFLLGGSFISPGNYIALLSPAGSIDTGFGANASVANTVLAIAVQSDGGIIIGGAFETVDGVSRNGIARLNADGSLDSSFDPGSGVDSGYASAVYAVALQSDGKIVLGGSFLSINGVPCNGIARLNADGSLDSSFDPGSGVDASTGVQVLALAVQSNGAIVIGGSFAEFNGVARGGLARISATGALGPIFSSQGGCDGVINSLAIQGDGNILAGGTFTTVNGTPRHHIARLLETDGSVDPTFDPGSGPDGFVTSVQVQSDGQIVLGGYFNSVGDAAENTVARLNIDGSVDTSFQPNTDADVSIIGLTRQPDDGKVLVCGQFYGVDGVITDGIVRLLPDGSRDPDFLLDHTLIDSVGQAAVVRPDHEILVALNFAETGFLTPDLPKAYEGPAGASIRGFHTNVRTPIKAPIINKHPGSSATTFGEVTLLHADGSVDATFKPFTTIVGTGTYRYNGGPILALAVQADGKFLVSDNAATSGLKSGPPIVASLFRFNADGSSDTGFTSELTAADTLIGAIALQPADGLIVAAVNYYSAPNSPVGAQVARLNTDGSIDDSFSSGTTTDGTITALALQADGKVLVGGSFSGFGSSAQNALLRLNTDGSLDTTFNPGVIASTSGTPVVTSIQVEPDGRIDIGGVFSSVNGAVRQNLARLAPDGSLGTGFAADGTGPDAAVRTMLLQPNGSILVGGDFSVVNGTAHAGVVRLLGSAVLPPQITAPTLVAAFGQSFSYQVTASNSPTSYAATGLPPGLAIDPVTGIISGTPLASGVFRVIVSAANAGGTGTVIFDLTVPFAGEATAASPPTAAFVTLYTFAVVTGSANSINPDGDQPVGGLVKGTDGNFYGATGFGGPQGTGTVFSITPGGAFSSLYDFPAFSNTGGIGVNPVTGLIFGPDGDLFCATSNGVFCEIAPTGALVAQTSFSNDIYVPEDTILLLGGDGNFYGISVLDSTGLILQITPAGASTTLYSFGGDGNGANPNDGLAVGNDGNIYGTTAHGGGDDYGLLYQITPAGVLTTTYSFTGDSDGGAVYSAPVVGRNGDLYGIAKNGGADGSGTFFEIAPGGALASVVGLTSADLLNAPTHLILGSDGNFYGTTLYGGASKAGSVVQITPTGVLTVLYSFTAGNDGASPRAILAEGSAGTFYGTSYGGANESGTIFSLAVSPGIVSPASASADIGQPFSYAIMATNSPTSFGASSLPPGLSIDSTMGLISGTPTAGGIFAVGLSATNAGGTATATLTLTIGAPVITSPLTANAQAGRAFAYQITATNNPTGYGAGNLPPGLNADAASGLVSGTPTAVGTYPVALSVANAYGTGTATLTLVVTAMAAVPPPVITSDASATAQVGTPFAYQIVATNNPSNYGASNVPAGLIVNPSTGLISGTPGAAGTVVVVLGAANASGTGTATLTLTINAAPIPVPAVNVVVAGDGMAVEGEESGKVIFRRTGDASAALTVHYKIKGTARAGIDYKAQNGILIIPAGAVQAKIKIKPISNAAVDSTRLAKVKLLPSPDGSYTLGSQVTAKIKIIDND